MVRLPRDGSAFWLFCYITLTLLLRPFLRLRVEGVENIPATGGAVLASNHVTNLDVLVLGVTSTRQIYYMAKSELFQVNPILTWALHEAGTFPVRRGLADTAALEVASALLKQGRVLGLFPEGSRHRALGRGKRGAVRLAMQNQVPLLPVAVIGTGYVVDGGWRRQLRRPLVTVRYGRPYYALGDAEDSTAMHQATTELMQNIAALLPAEMRGVYGQTEEFSQ